MSETIKEKLSALMRALPFVEWDRFIDLIEPDQSIMLYGWIARDDGRSDFVHITYWTDQHPYYCGLTFTSSSALHSEQIAHEINVLNGVTDTDAPHIDCTRLETAFADVPNIIRL